MNLARFSVISALALTLATAGCAVSTDAPTRTTRAAFTGTVTATATPEGLLGDMAESLVSSFIDGAVGEKLFPQSSLDVEALLARIDDKIRQALIDDALRGDKTFLTAAMTKLNEADLERADIGLPGARSADEIYQLVVSDSTMNNVDLVLASVGPDADLTFRKSGLTLFIGAAQMKANRLRMQMDLHPSTARSDHDILRKHLSDAVTHAQLTMGLLRSDDARARRDAIGGCTPHHSGGDHWTATFSDDSSGYTWSDESRAFRSEGQALAHCNAERDGYRAKVDSDYSSTLDTTYAFDASMIGKWQDAIDALDGANGATSSRFTSVAFGGMYGIGVDYYGAQAYYANDLVGSSSCPSGYDANSVYGKTNVDWPLYACERKYNSVSDDLFGEFGGMYSEYSGEVGKQQRLNGITGTFYCPSGFVSWRVLDANATDASFFVCARPHTPGTKAPYLYGGMYTLDGAHPNLMTGGDSCPSGFKASLVGGSYRADGANSVVTDVGLVYCWKQNT